MDKAIHNINALHSVFGNVDVLNNAKLINIIYGYASKKIDLDFQIFCKVEHPSSRWKSFDKMHVNLSFSVPKNLTIALHTKEFQLKEWHIKEDAKSQHHFEFTFIQDEDNFIKFTSLPMIVSNISPLH